jgi:hypothetical protein
MEQFLLDAKVKAVGVLDTSLNNEVYNYVGITDVVATPWLQANPVKPIGYAEGFLKIEDILLIHPLDPEAQERIQLMPTFESIFFYVDRFVIRGNLNKGPDMALSGILDSLDKRFLTLKDVSVFPMFPATAAMPENMPIALLNRAKISHYHGGE